LQEGRSKIALRLHQRRPSDQLPPFLDMRPDRREQRAPLARILSVDEPVRVAARRAAFGLARKIFV